RRRRGTSRNCISRLRRACHSDDNAFSRARPRPTTVRQPHRDRPFGRHSRGVTMHFWNKLSTAALMRLTILASLNLLLVRAVGSLETLLHPWFFLIVVTLNLGLYAVMVYSGTLNTTLIGMMLAGLAATVGTLAYAGMDPTSFMYGGPFARIGRWVESLLDYVLGSPLAQ